MSMQYNPNSGAFKMKPMKIGDDVHNSDRCPPGKKFNLRLGKCIPLNAQVGQDGIVTVAVGPRSVDDNDPTPPPAPPEAGEPNPDAAVGAERAKRAKAKIMASKKGPA